MVNGNKEDLEPSITETFNVEADVTASPRNIPGYTLVGFGTNPENYGNFVDNKFNAKMPGENLAVTYIYEENENIAISYQSESLTKGTVTLDTESIAPATRRPQGFRGETRRRLCIHPLDQFQWRYRGNRRGQQALHACEECCN